MPYQPTKTIALLTDADVDSLQKHRMRAYEDYVRRLSQVKEAYKSKSRFPEYRAEQKLVELGFRVHDEMLLKGEREHCRMKCCDILKLEDVEDITPCCNWTALAKARALENELYGPRDAPPYKRFELKGLKKMTRRHKIQSGGGLRFDPEVKVAVFEVDEIGKKAPRQLTPTELKFREAQEDNRKMRAIAQDLKVDFEKLNIREIDPESRLEETIRHTHKVLQTIKLHKAFGK